jgi:hypothetical protein
MVAASDKASSTIIRRKALWAAQRRIGVAAHPHTEAPGALAIPWFDTAFFTLDGTCCAVFAFFTEGKWT